MTQPLFFTSTHASGSSFSTKRKLHTDGDSDNESHSQRLIKSPPLKRRATFPVPQPYGVPELVADHSTPGSGSGSDNDMAMDQDHDQDMDVSDQSMVRPAKPMSRYGESFVPRYDYEYGMSGSGGIGFGPGAEEDDDFTEEMMEEPKMGFGYHTLPSLTPHTNPHHFSNVPPYTNTPLSFNGMNASGMGNGTTFTRATSPLSAQPFSTSLRAPLSSPGLMQPKSAGPLPMDATDVERARAVHGPNCKSIPKLVISPHADPVTGKQAMYSMCPDCGSCERAA